MTKTNIDREEKEKEKLNKLPKTNLEKRKKYSPTRREILDCMKHDSHRRVGGRVRQVRWGR